MYSERLAQEPAVTPSMAHPQSNPQGKIPHTFMISWPYHLINQVGELPVPLFVFYPFLSNLFLSPCFIHYSIVPPFITHLLLHPFTSPSSSSSSIIIVILLRPLLFLHLSFFFVPASSVSRVIYSIFFITLSPRPRSKMDALPATLTFMFIYSTRDLSPVYEVLFMCSACPFDFLPFLSLI